MRTGHDFDVLIRCRCRVSMWWDAAGMYVTYKTPVRCVCTARTRRMDRRPLGCRGASHIGDRREESLRKSAKVNLCEGKRAYFVSGHGRGRSSESRERRSSILGTRQDPQGHTGLSDCFVSFPQLIFDKGTHRESVTPASRD